MVAFRILLLLGIVLPVEMVAQVNRYVVFFKDKANTPYTVGQPEAFLSARAINRRIQQNVVIDATDLPVTPSYVSQLRATGARTFFSTRWLNGTLIEIGDDSLYLVQSLPFVQAIEYVAPGHKLSGGRIKKFQQASSSSAVASVQVQFTQVGIDVMHSAGYHGENISIAILDDGFVGVSTTAPFQELFQNGQVKSTFDFVGNTGNVYQYDGHGTEVFSILAATVPGTFTGGVYAADFHLFVTEDVSTEFRIEEYNWLFGAERADSTGVDLISTSLGYSLFDDPSMDYSPGDLNGKIAVISQAASFALSKGIVVVCSAGNEGGSPWMYITPPADVAGILSCGAVDELGQRVVFSSIGPTVDKRIKPDVMALGSGDVVILPEGIVGSSGGTSFSCPLVAGLAAGILQAHPGLKVSEVYNAITKSADQAFAPDNFRGYGIPHFSAVQNYIHAIAQDDDVILYPNPLSTGLLNVALKDPTDQPLTVTIYDWAGRVLSSTTFPITWANNPFQINVDNMAPGLYLLKISCSGLTKTMKWVKV
jgi:serine protease AprX